MNFDDLKKDAEFAHAVFDLCGIPRQTRGTAQRSLRIRALILAEMAGFNKITDDALEAQRQKMSESKSDS